MSRVDTRIGYRVALEGFGGKRSYFTGYHHNNLGDTPQAMFAPHRRDGNGRYVSVSAFMPDAPVVFDTRAEADAKLDELARHRGRALASVMVVVDADDTVVSQFLPPRRRHHPYAPPGCDDCGSVAWRRADDLIVCRVCGHVEEA